MDKMTQKSKGYGFVTFKGMDGAHAALENPEKMIDVSVNTRFLYVRAHDCSWRYIMCGDCICRALAFGLESEFWRNNLNVT